MAMTLRLSGDQTELLRQLAAIEGRSMQEIALEAVNSFVEERLASLLVKQYAREAAVEYADLLRRLAE